MVPTLLGQRLNELEKKFTKRQQELKKIQEGSNISGDEESNFRETIKHLAEEANEAKNAKVDQEKELKQISAPLKRHERDLQALTREQQNGKKRLKTAAKHLHDAREQIKDAAGNAKSEEAKRTKRMEKAEKDLASARERCENQKEAIAESLQKYEELEPHVEQAKQNCAGVNSQLHAVRKKIQALESSSGDNLALFGQKCAAMQKKVCCHQNGQS